MVSIMPAHRSGSNDCSSPSCSIRILIECAGNPLPERFLVSMRQSSSQLAEISAMHSFHSIASRKHSSRGVIVGASASVFRRAYRRCNSCSAFPAETWMPSDCERNGEAESARPEASGSGVELVKSKLQRLYDHPHERFFRSKKSEK